MSVHFMTSSPDALLREFNRRIVQEEAWGKAEGWMLKGDTSYQHSEDVSDRDNDKQHILRPIVAFLAGKKLPNDFPSIDILQYTQSGATPPPLPNEAR